MLILSRKSDESVVIGGSDGSEHMTTITVVEIRGREVRLGFEANKSVPIHRAEVWERIHNGGTPDSTSPKIGGELDRWNDDGGTLLEDGPTRAAAPPM